jgi:predicted Fe-Mo cluster-binding NifX family protein
MSKIAFTSLRKNSDSPLSPHFGKAKWLLILDTGSNVPESIQNTGLTGRAVVDLLKSNHCEDVVFNGIGPGALKQLKEAQIGGWFAPLGVPVVQLMKMFSSGQLHLARKPTPGRGRRSNQASAAA